jgi:hypothetical protein
MSLIRCAIAVRRTPSTACPASSTLPIARALGLGAFIDVNLAEFSS